MNYKELEQAMDSCTEENPCPICRAQQGLTTKRSAYHPVAKPSEGKTGFTCTICGERNDYAASNRPDGTYQCSYHGRTF